MNADEQPDNVRVTSTLISASAGTGKTYQLSLRFISLLALGAQPEAMAAITFTRKAAGEFADRILRDLAAGADSPQGAASLRLRILGMWQGKPGFPGLSPLADESRHPLTQERFRHLLRRLIDALGRLRLSTIDSLFASLVRMSSFELGLSDVRMVDESAREQERANALEFLYMSFQEDEDSMNEFLDRFSAMTQEGERSDMETTLQNVVASYHSAYLETPDTEAWGNLEAFGISLEAAGEPLPDTYWKDRAALIETLLPQANIARKNVMNGYESALRKLQSDSWDLSSIKTIEQDSALPHSGEENEAYLRLKGVVRELIAATEREAMRKVRDKSRALPQILARYEEVYRERVRSRGLYDFDDITRSLPDVLGSNGAPSVLAYRMDGRIRHWMLDEFQDTSLVQWNGLRTFLEEVATDAAMGDNRSASRSLFVVGDVKQSIYGWRGGEPRLFRALQAESPWQDALQACSMATSYRSSSVVLDFVNAVFGYTGEAKHRAAEPAAGGRERPGYLEVYRLAKGKADETMLMACETVGDILRSLPLKTSGMSCAILLRKKSEVDAMCGWIRSNLPGIHVESLAETSVGIDSPLGMTLLQLFRWLRHPGNDYAAALVARSPLGKTVFGERNRNEAWTYWNRLAETEGCAAVLRHLRDGLANGGPGLLSPYHRDRLDIWMNDAESFDVQGGSLEDWIRRMQSRSQTANPPKSFVHVMTVHKSKGLEYDAVILPLLDKKAFDDQSRLDYFKALDSSGRMNGFLFAPPKAVRERYPQLQPYIEEWSEKQRQEGRNLLYVALTRAAHANYIIVPNKPSSGTSGGMVLAGIEAATGMPPENDGESVELIHTAGDRAWYAGLASAGEEPVEETIRPLPPPPRRYERRSPSIRPDEDEIGRPAETAENAEERRRILEFGHEVHAVFERILWWNPVEKPEWAANPATDAERLVLQCMNEAAIARAFAEEPGAIVLREQRLEAIVGQEWISSVIDRLIIHPDKTATVIDYKTNRNASEQELRNRYAEQMGLYRKLVAMALQLPGGESGVSAFLLSTDLKRLIPM